MFHIHYGLANDSVPLRTLGTQADGSLPILWCISTCSFQRPICREERVHRMIERGRSHLFPSSLSEPVTWPQSNCKRSTRNIWWRLLFQHLFSFYFSIVLIIFYCIICIFYIKCHLYIYILYNLHILFLLFSAFPQQEFKTYSPRKPHYLQLLGHKHFFICSCCL